MQLFNFLTCAWNFCANIAQKHGWNFSPTAVDLNIYIYIYICICIYITLYAIGCERNSFLKNKLGAFFQRSLPLGKCFSLPRVSFISVTASGRVRSIVISKWHNKIGEKSLIKLNLLSVLNQALSRRSSSNLKVEYAY